LISAELKPFQFLEIVGNKRYISKFVISQFEIFNMVHALLFSSCDTDGFIVYLFFDKRQHLFLFFVGFSDFGRYDALLLGSVLSDINMLLTLLLRNIKHEVLLEELPLCTLLDQLVYLYDLLLAFFGLF